MQDLLGWNLIVSLPAILLVAWLAGRLLGVSRGWAATVVPGLVGWLAALALSLAIAEGDPRAPGFGRNLWVFAIVFTMSAAVWIELLAKPGVLARAQTSLVSLPRPIRAVRRSGQRVGRYAQITRIASSMASGRRWGWAGRRRRTRSSWARLPPGGFGWPWRSAAACSSSSASSCRRGPAGQ